MTDITPDQLKSFADIAGLRVLDEDVENLTWRFNALSRSLSSLDEQDMTDVLPMPFLPHPRALPDHDRSGAKPTLTTETDLPLPYKPMTELAALIRAGKVSATDLTDAYLERIERYDDLLKSYITVTPDTAHREAIAIEQCLAAGEDIGPLGGIPLGYKDEFYTKGILTTGGAAVLSEFVPDYDAAVVEKLRDAGAVSLGKLNMTEWATPLTLKFPYGQPTNPWNIEYDAGGSSTGSGSATAAGLAAGSIGEDTGGSIRRPASHSNTVGLRPSWGRVSTYGMIASVWYQDTAAPLARTVADCALLLNAIAGYDPRDPTSADLPVPDYTAVLDGNIKGMRIGLVKETQEAAHIHPEVKAAAAEAAKVFASLVAIVEEVSLPLITRTGTFNTALGSGRTALQWRYLNERGQDYDVAVRRYTILPALLPAGLLQRAYQLRSLVRAQVLAACEQYDILISPCQPGPPPKIVDTKKQPTSQEDALRETANFGPNAIATYAGIPALSLPCGFSNEGLPIGLQVMAKRYDEEAVFKAAYAYEQHTPWHTMIPPVGKP